MRGVLVWPPNSDALATIIMIVIAWVTKQTHVWRKPENTYIHLPSLSPFTHTQPSNLVDAGTKAGTLKAMCVR